MAFSGKFLLVIAALFLGTVCGLDQVNNNLLLMSRERACVEKIEGKTLKQNLFIFHLQFSFYTISISVQFNTPMFNVLECDN